ncbi:MAG TPA: aminotransferase class V-fold PLP-dependent enzyme [Anaerolineales bacterium]|nr:aminotransferase class V-fold PLP-dependent enzyme [Anaerolineales bacterium]
MCAPKGAGFLYARPEMQSLLKPLVVSWGDELDFADKSTKVNDHEFWGTRDVSAFLAVPSAIKFQDENNWDEVRDSWHQLAGYAQKRICELTGIPPLHSQTDVWFCQMAAARSRQILMWIGSRISFMTNIKLRFLFMNGAGTD